jgi:hypothetical protein
MEDLKAVSYGHAVSSLGYEVKLVKHELTWKDGKHTLLWEADKQKDGRLLIKRKSRDLKHAQGLGDRELGMVDDTVLRAMKVLHINAYFG